MNKLIRSSFKGKKERKEDPGRFNPIEPDASSAPTNKYPGFMPTIHNKITRNSSHAVRNSHVHEKSRTGASFGNAVEHSLEPEDAGVDSSTTSGERSWYDHDSHHTHNEPGRFIASGQSARDNARYAREGSTSPYRVSPLDPGRTVSTSMNSHEVADSAEGDDVHKPKPNKYVNRFQEEGSALRWPTTDKRQPTLAPIPQQRAAELSADETSTRMQKHELPVRNLSCEELEAKAPKHTLANGIIERKAVPASSVDPKHTHEDSDSTPFGHTVTAQPAPSRKRTIDHIPTEPPNLMTESLHDNVQGRKYEDDDQYAPSRFLLSTEQWDEHELFLPSTSYQPNIESQTRYTEPKEAVPIIPSFTDQTNHRIEESPSQRQRDHTNPASWVDSYVTEHEHSTTQDCVHSTKHVKTKTASTTVELESLNARIREALRVNNVPLRRELDPLSNLLTWFSDERGAKERIIESLSADPKKRDVKTLKKEVGKLTKENQSLATYKLRHEDLKNEIKVAQGEIDALRQELAQAKKEGRQAHKDLDQQKIESKQSLDALLHERNDCVFKLKATEQKLESVDKERSSAQAGLERYKKQRDEYIQENGQLRRSLEHVRKEKEQEMKEAEEALINAALRHQAEALQLEEKHSQQMLELEHQKDQEVSEIKHKSDLKAQDMQAIIDGKDRMIAAQDLRMASYSKPTHGLISDGDFAHRFRDLSMKLDTLVDAIPRPQQYFADSALDPSNFLGRNAARGARVWSKFARRVCWDVIMRGFFQRQPGFGVFGSQGDGHATLLHLYQLFTPSSTQDTITRATFPNNKKANDWRASLFEAILKEVKSTFTDLAVHGFPAFFRANVRAVAEDLTTTLQKICQTIFDPQCLRLIPELCNEFGVLSLQMGSQQSLVVLATCEHEEYVQPEVFKDDNNYSENDLQVDIMIQPSLKRIGDGSQDLNKEKVLVVGDIVSLKEGY